MKRTSVSHSTFLDLKAEILAKKTQLLKERSAKSLSDFSRPSPLKKVPKHDTCALPDVASKEPADDWEKSRAALERKMSIYDQMRKGELRQNHDSSVDFDSKQRIDSSVSRIARDHSSDGLVEYVDEFGRSRVCKKDELRAGWHAPLATANVHYTRGAEIRTHGLGFYQFSTEIAGRIQQQSELTQLHGRTEASRIQYEAICSKRQQYRDMRIRCARERRERLKLREGKQS